MRECLAIHFSLYEVLNNAIISQFRRHDDPFFFPSKPAQPRSTLFQRFRHERIRRFLHKLNFDFLWKPT